MTIVTYGLYDGDTLVATIEGPETITENTIAADLGHAFTGQDLSTVLVIRESTGADALNRIFG